MSCTGPVPNGRTRSDTTGRSPGVAPLRIAYARARLARVYVQTGTLEAAERTTKKARQELQALQALFGPAHVQVIAMRIELAAIYRLECRLAEAEGALTPQERAASRSGGSSVSSGRGSSRALPSGSVAWHSSKMRAVQAAHFAASSLR